MAVAGSELSGYARRARESIEVFKQYAVRDVVSLYANLDERADKVAEEEFERLGAQPVGEYGDADLGDLAETAQEAGMAFYETMTNLRQSTLNLFAAGLYHLVEQQTANLCHDRSFGVPPKNYGQDGLSCSSIQVFASSCVKKFRN